MTSNLFSDLQHKVVLVTGSSSGIGEAIVTLFSQLGAYVVVTGRNADKVSRVALKCEQLSPFNYKPLTFVGDLMKDENIEQLVKQTIEKHSKIDVLVNNAGSETTLLGASLLDADFLEKYEKVMRLEVATRLKICRLTMPSLIESK
ncbi:3-oxoacyl-[acyl-carrier-protein] reductase FabG-like protein, partial [Dinothrombium tinctorium]